MWHISKVTFDNHHVLFNCGIHLWLCRIVTLSMGYMSNMKKGYVPLKIKKWYIQWHNQICDLLIMWHSMFIKDYVSFWCLWRLCRITALGKCYMYNMRKGYVTFYRSLRIKKWYTLTKSNMWHSKFNVLCCIATFTNCYVTLWHWARVICRIWQRVMSHSNIH